MSKLVAVVAFRILALAVVVGMSSRAHAAVFTKIVASGATIPGTTSTFGTLAAPSVDGNDVAFWGVPGLLNSDQGLYVISQGQIRRVADYTMTAPGTQFPFASFGVPWFVQGHLGFTASFRDGFTNGLYDDIVGLTKITDTLSTIPGKTERFNFLLHGSFDGTHTAFYGTGASGYKGIFTNANGIHAIVDSTTPVPGGQGTFTGFWRPRFQNSDLVFVGRWGTNSAGVYSTTGGLRALADVNTIIPGRTDKFTDFTDSWANENIAVFLGKGASSQGLYTTTGNDVVRIADTSTLALDTNASFTSFDFNSVSLSGDKIAFKATSGGVTGIYLYQNGVVSKVVNSLDILDGSARSLAFGTDGLSGNNLVFDAFVGNNHIIYMTIVPEPGMLIFFTIAVLPFLISSPRIPGSAAR